MVSKDRKIVLSVYDAILSWIGTWQSISSIALFTLGTVFYGLWVHASREYWEIINLLFSVMAILESEIILIGQKRKDDVDRDSNKKLFQMVGEIYKRKG